jgi:hypothetical protein
MRHQRPLLRTCDILQRRLEDLENVDTVFTSASTLEFQVELLLCVGRRDLARLRTEPLPATTVSMLRVHKAVKKL